MFYVPPTKKTFSFAAIASWGDRLASAPNAAWEQVFSADSREQGRKIYREIDHPFSVFLENSNAAVQFRTENFGDIHVFFNVDPENKFHWRTSLEDKEEAAPWAVAAMFFVEEFVGDEFSKIPLKALEDFSKSAEKERTGTRAKPDREIQQASANENSAFPRGNENSAEKAVPAKTLELTFEAAETSISFSANWISRDVPEKKFPALGNGALSSETLSGAELSQFVRLAVFAREALFSYESENARYTLFGIAQIKNFANALLPKWKNRFQISNAGILDAFKISPREISAEAILRTLGNDNFSLKWNFELGGKSLSAEERKRVISHAGEAFFLPGRGVVKLKNGATNFVSDWPETGKKKLPIYALLSIFREENSVKISLDAKLSAWRKNFLTEPAVPENLSDILRPYQQKGAAWIFEMLERGAHPLVADEMGLGKTLQVLTAIALGNEKFLRSRGNENQLGNEENSQLVPEKVLVVCPASVVPVWRNEIRKFFPGTEIFRYLPHKKSWSLVPEISPESASEDASGTIDASQQNLFSGTTLPKICLVSYGNFRRNFEEIVREKFGWAILDEAQFIKNPKTKIAQTCLKIKARRRLALTGTPIENRHLDLWTIFRFLMPGLLGRRATFEELFSDAEDSEEILEKIRVQISPFILRRTKNEVAKELPEKTQNVLICPLSERQRALYSDFVEASLKEFEGDKISPTAALGKNALGVLTLLMRLRQISCDPALLPGEENIAFSESGKISVLLERVQEIVDSGGKIVIFSQFVSFLKRVESALAENFAGTPIFVLTGKTLDRDAPVKNFQSEKGAAIFLVSLRAGGTGLTLSSAEYVFLLDPWWNPAVEEQAIDRVHRIGQKKHVFVYRMIAAGTVEERVEKLKHSKLQLFNSLIGEIPDMSDWAKHFPSLKSLIALASD